MIIDVTRLVGRLLNDRLPTGVDRVDIEYVRHYHSSSRALIRYRGRWVFLSFERSQLVFRALITQNQHAKWAIRRAVFFSSFRLERSINIWGELLLNISHSGLDEEEYSKNSARYGLKPIYFIHDLIPIEYPEYSRIGESKRHQKRLETLFQTAKGVILNSYDTLHTLQAYAQRKNALMPEWKVAHLGVTSLSCSEEKPFINQPYFVILGTIEGRKNHLLLLNVWREITKKERNNAPILVIIGKRGWEAEQVCHLLDRCETLRPSVIELSHCTDVDLSRWLKHARALLFPSFAEGYGLPLAEALSMSIPIIASDLDVFREIAGEIPEYLSPIDGTGWATMIQEYANTDSKMRLKQISRISSFAPVYWENHFERVDPFIEKIDKL